MKLYLKQNNITFGDEDTNTQIENEIKLIDKIVDKFDKLNKKEKADLLMHFYTVYLNDKDILKFLNSRHKKHFNKIIPIHTKMEFESKSSSSKIERQKIIIECATTKDFVLEGKTYSYDEIISLCNEGKIYPLYLIINPINSYSENKEEPKFINCFVTNEIDVKKDELGYKLLLLNKEDENTFLKLVAKTYNNSEIMSDIKEYTQELIEEFLQYES